MKNITTKLLWAVFLALLGVLLPHTAWLFGRFEPATGGGLAAAWAGAFAFESAIAVLVHKLARHWESTPKRATSWTKFRYRWLNAYVAGLAIAAAVSALANLAHAVEFGRALEIFAAWGISAQIYQVAFGGALPVVSLLFARVLSNETTSEDTPDPALDEAKKTITELKAQVRQSEQMVKEAEARARDAETRFAVIGDFVARLNDPEKRERIIAVRERWPGLPNSAVAIIAETSPGYVSEVVNGSN